MPFFQDNGSGAPNFARGATEWATATHTIFATDGAYNSYLSSAATFAPKEFKVFCEIADSLNSSVTNTFRNYSTGITEVIDTDGIHNAGIITVPYTGLFQLAASVKITAVSGTDYVDNLYVGFRINGVNEAVTLGQNVLDAGNNAAFLTSFFSGYAVRQLTAGQLIQPQIYVGMDATGRYDQTRLRYSFKPF